MLIQPKRTLESGFKRGTALIRDNVPGLLTGRERNTPEVREAAKHRFHEKRRAKREAKESLRAEQVALMERLAREAGVSVPLLRAEHLLTK